jgi:hypothetical protein
MKVSEGWLKQKKQLQRTAIHPLERREHEIETRLYQKSSNSSLLFILSLNEEFNDL